VRSTNGAADVARHSQLMCNSMQEARVMSESVFDKADAQAAESIRRLSRATSAMAEAIDEGVGVFKRAVKRSGDAAEELVDDTTQRIKRHPVEATATTFAVGVIVGGVIGWMISRK
jgi:ElaB/YqjD/DUF883 family membrane-anchored ribosome-binding protein